jgi:hypothetical protein
MDREFEREKFIKERLKLEESVADDIKVEIRENVLDVLKNEKGYLDEDIEIDKVFELTVDDKKENVSVDFIINLKGKRFIAIKCSPCSLESRERHIIAFSRVVDSYQIPISVITSGSYSRVLDTVSGKLLSEDINFIPSRDEALKTVDTYDFKKYPEDKLQRQMRILLAFESIKCSVIDI